jgi:hypothetical protein
MDEIARRGGPSTKPVRFSRDFEDHSSRFLSTANAPHPGLRVAF